MKRPTSKAARPSVVPPYLLDRLAQAADARLSARAVNTLRIDTSQRAVRLAAPPAPASARPPGQVDRQVHDAGGGLQLPGALVRSEGQPAHADVAVNEAYDHLGATYALFWQAYGRHSLDGAGRALVASVHYGEEYDNAFWNGAQMVFGDGDGDVFNRFTIAVDIVAHELTHGVIDHEGGLRYEGQSGALNESLCDVFGSLAKQHVAGQRADQADWLIGAGLFTAKVRARAALDGAARQRLRRSPAGPRPAAGTHAGLRADRRGQWRRAYQFRHSQPCIPSGRHRAGRPCLGGSRPDLVRHLAPAGADAAGRFRPVRAPVGGTGRPPWRGPGGGAAGLDRCRGTDMIALPSLEQAAEVRVSRQGGVAFVLALVRTRRFELGACSATLRAQIDAALHSAAGQARDACGQGDQRYFRVEVHFGAGSRAEPLRFDVPEELAPHDLVWLWRSAPTR